MLEQLLQLIQQSGQSSVVDNPDVPNEFNQDVLADATKTIAGGFQNVMAGGGLENIIDLFRGNKGGAGNASGGSSLLKNPMVTMMIGHFISKLVGKYQISPPSASRVANNLIPNALQGIITETNNPANTGFTLDNLIGSLTDGQGGQSSGGFSLQGLLDQFSGSETENSGSGGFDLQNLIGNVTQKAQNRLQEQQQTGGGLMDLIKGLL